MATMRRLIAAMLSAGIVVALAAMPVLAFDARAGDRVTVPAGEAVDEDLYLAGQTIVSDANVNGDAFVGGQTVTIGGSVLNGLTVGGQTVLVTGNIGHGVRAAGETVDIAGTVGRDVVAAAATLIVHDTASVGGDLALGAGTALIRGDVAGDVRGGAEELTIEGTVRGNVTVKVGRLVVSPGASIEGNLFYTGPTEASIPAGTVKGTVQFTQRVENRPGAESREDWGVLAPLAVLTGLTWKILTYLMALITGIVIIAIAPRRMAGAAAAIRTDTGPVAGYGAIALFVTPIAALVVCLTVIGLPLGIITLALWAILLYLSQLPVSLLIGHLVLGRDRPLETKGFMIGCLALGLLLLWLVKAIPVVGFFVSLATALFGLGAIVVSERTRLRL